MARSTEPRRSLLDRSEIREAALWRLSDWTLQEREEVTAAIQQLLGKGVAMSSEQPEVAWLLASMGRTDRRDPWTALCALLTLVAEVMGDADLYWRAGLGVLEAHRQALRRSRVGGQDALDRLLSDYLRLHPDTTTRALFKHCQSLAPLRVVVVDETDDSLTYCQHASSARDKTLRWHAFEQRVSRLRQAISLEEDQPGNRLQRAWQQPVAVSSGG